MNLINHSIETPTYIIFTPMRNEIATIEKTLNSTINQTITPKLWMIMDDGSTDGSVEIVKKYIANNSWIKLHTIADRGFDYVGKGVAELFNSFLKINKDVECAYIAKLDADIDLPVNYFESLLTFMETNRYMGLCSGHPYTFENGKKILERHSTFFPSGTARLYRKQFLLEIGDFVASVGWDTVDILRMRLHNYGTRVLHNLQFHHMRRMGTRGGYINGIIRDGRNAYLTGYTPLFFICRAIFNIKYRPFLLRTICMLLGYFSFYFKRVKRVVSDEEFAFHKHLQRKRLLFKSID